MKYNDFLDRDSENFKYTLQYFCTRYQKKILSVVVDNELNELTHNFIVSARRRNEVN